MKYLYGHKKKTRHFLPGYMASMISNSNLALFFHRLTPAYMFCLLFYDKMTGFLGEGPLWYEMQADTHCNKYWWTNLLYINNFYPTAMNNSVRFVLRFSC